MTDPKTKYREQAEQAFNLLQTQRSERSRAVAELDAVAIARDEKTARLRALRLAQADLNPPQGTKTRRRKAAKA